MTPPFFTASLSRARAAVVPWAPQRLQSHFLQNVGHRIAHRRGGRQGEVDNAKGYAQPLGGLLGRPAGPCG